MHSEEDKILSPRSLWDYAEKALVVVNQTFPEASVRSDAAAIPLYRATEQLLSVLKMIIEKPTGGGEREADQTLSSDVSLMLNNVSISQSPSPVPPGAFSSSSPSSPLHLNDGTPRKRPRSQITESRMSPLDLSRIQDRGVQPPSGPQSAERISQRLPSIHQILSDRELRPLQHHACETPRGQWKGNSPQPTYVSNAPHHFSPQQTPGMVNYSTDSSPRYQNPVSPQPSPVNDNSPRGTFSISHFSGSGGGTSPTPQAANRKGMYQQGGRAPSAPNASPGVTFTDRPYEVGDDKKGLFGHFSVLNSAVGEQGNDFPHEKEKRQRRKKNADIDLKCLECSTRETPEWRRGPKGPKTLCNACGLKYAKKLKQQQQQQQRQQQSPTGTKTTTK